MKTIMTLKEARKALINILEEWEKGMIGGWEMQGCAEDIEEKLLAASLIRVQSEIEGIPAQIDAVLNQLTNAGLQSTLPLDINAMLMLLKAKDGDIAVALSTHTNYWDQIDYDSRENEVRKYWY